MSAGGAAAAVANNELEDVFKIFIYKGDGSSGSSTQTMQTDLDLSTHGGMVWIYSRDTTDGNWLWTTNPNLGGVSHRHQFSDQGNVTSGSTGITDISSTGFTVTGDDTDWNYNGNMYFAYNFRRCPKFFDVVRYTGNGTAGREIAHSLEEVPGMIMIKHLDLGAGGAGYDWWTYHRQMTQQTGVASENSFLRLRQQDLNDNTGIFNDTAPTSTVFTVGSDDGVNKSGVEYVALLWSHNTSGGFGAAGDQDIIKCDWYAGDGASQKDIDVGFKTQFLWVTDIGDMDGHHVYSTTVSNLNNHRHHNTRDQTYINTGSRQITFQNRGFRIENGTGDKGLNRSGHKFLYMAIREGTKIPSAGTEVYKAEDVTAAANDASPGFRTDFCITQKRSNGTQYFMARPVGNGRYMTTHEQGSWNNYTSDGGAAEFDYVTNKFQQNVADTSPMCYQMFSSRVGVLDVGCYQPTASADYTLYHNLGVTPEMIWIRHTTNTYGEYTHVEASGVAAFGSKYGNLDHDRGFLSLGTGEGVTAASATSITLNNAQITAESGTNYLYWLWATLAGVSKVGTYTGNDGTQTIDCGFSSAARFVLIKETSDTGHWVIFDHASGIVAGDDTGMKLSTNSAEQTADAIDADSSGFIVNEEGTWHTNEGSSEYLFLALA